MECQSLSHQAENFFLRLRREALPRCGEIVDNLNGGITALRQLGEPLVRGSYKNGLSIIGKDAVAFSLFVELNCGDVEGRR